MKPLRYNRNIVIACCVLVILIILAGQLKKLETEKEPIRLIYLKQQVLDFANKYKNQNAIVVSKTEHLLFFCENGKIVENDRWNGFNFSFPVQVALAARYYRTPEGEMFIDRKNERSRYTLFLGLSYPGAYGIHGAATHLASYLNKMEQLDPNFKFVTKKDDTRGCVAVENRVIKYLFAKIGVKTPVLILP
jgi:lipoprotein-anchoring transpeptidase ErfK/SrfK